MSKVLKFSAPKAVECQGEAKRVLDELSAVALRLLDLKEQVAPELRQTVEDIHKDLCSVVRLMTAIDETMSVIKDYAEDICEICPPGTKTAYINGITSVEVVVSGFLFVRLSTIVLETFVVQDNSDLITNQTGKVLRIGQGRNKEKTIDC